MIGDEIEIKIISFDKDGIRIGIEAPREMPIYRKEIYIQIQEENQHAVAKDKGQLSQLNNLFRDLTK
jgi:carbon storage regulator